MPFFKKEVHPVLARMTAEERASANRTSWRMSLQEVKAAEKNYASMYPNISLPENEHEKGLVLGYISNHRGYPSPHSGM